MKVALLVASVLASAATGCVSSSEPDTVGSPTSNDPKADDPNSGDSLVEVSEDDQQWLRAADVECFHRGAIESDPYYQAVKLLCFDRGGVAAPTALYVAVTPVGEIGGAYKIYALPGYVSADPENVQFAATTNGTQLTFTASTPDVDDAGDITYKTSSFTVDITLSGDNEDPTITTGLQIQ